MKHKLLRWAFASAFIINTALAQSFQVNKIDIQGLKKVPKGTVLNYLPVQLGDQVNDEALEDAIRSLYNTHFFDDVALYREGETLVVKLVERPSIASIEVKGNDLISDDDLKSALKNFNVVEGRIFDQTIFARIQRELLMQYHDQGYYGVRIKPVVETLERQRVALKIHIYEGEKSALKRINIVGNNEFDDKRLTSQFSLGKDDWWKFWSDSSEYSKFKLQGDLETLRSYYLNRGYADFKILSHQVALSPNKEDVDVTVNIEEGKQYRFNQTAFAGYEDLLTEQKLKELQTYQPQDEFSREKLLATSKAIQDALSEQGYAFAKVIPVPELDKNNQKVDVNFLITPNHKVYVRRIEIKGNFRTSDVVVRREFRQLESALYMPHKVRLTEGRLQRLGYFSTVKTNVKQVAFDQVDLEVQVEEAPTGSFQVGISYAQTGGIGYSLGLNEKNFLGSGNAVGINILHGDAEKNYSLSLTDPYFTKQGHSLGGRVYYSQTDGAELDITEYNTDSAGAAVTYGIPMSEYSRITLGAGFDSTSLTCGTSLICQDTYGSDGFDATKATMSAAWKYDNRNQALFPTDGSQHIISGELAVPGLDLQYYKVTGKHSWYYPIFKQSSVQLRGEYGLIKSYGDTDIPFYERFYTGGINSVRGFQGNTLGPKYPGTTDPVGGEFKTVARAAMYFPLSFSEEDGGSSNTRWSLFVDAGNVFESLDTIEPSDLRASAGAAFMWITPVGPLAFSYAVPLKEGEDDELQAFQFSLGMPF